MSNKVALLEKRLISLYRAVENINVQIDRVCDQIDAAEVEEQNHPKLCRDPLCWCNRRSRRAIEI